jgi:hypothetical protein
MIARGDRREIMVRQTALHRESATENDRRGRTGAGAGRREWAAMVRMGNEVS